MRSGQALLLVPEGTVKKSAQLSPCRRHRYSLSRVWDKSLPAFIVIGLNPSTADETLDDPTIRRCVNFAKREGCGSLIMVNLFSYRSASPKALECTTLEAVSNPINIRVVTETVEREAKKGGIVVCAWGVGGALHGYGDWFKILLGAYALKCLGHTKEGHPRHPLYVKADQPLERWAPFSQGVTGG
jgi:hypothetical protein